MRTSSSLSELNSIPRSDISDFRRCLLTFSAVRGSRDLILCLSCASIFRICLLSRILYKQDMSSCQLFKTWDYAAVPSTNSNDLRTGSDLVVDYIIRPGCDKSEHCLRTDCKQQVKLRVTVIIQKWVCTTETTSSSLSQQNSTHIKHQHHHVQLSKSVTGDLPSL